MARHQDDLPTLIAQAGPLNGQRWAIESSILVGRESSCDIVIPNRQVSRYHARFTAGSDGVMLEDLGSKNGTHCNGEPVLGAVILQDGDVIQIALAQQFVYISSEATLPLTSDTLPEPANAPRRLRLEKRSRRLWIMEQELTPPLSFAQFTLMELLYERQGRVVSRQDLITAIWGDEEAVNISEQALDALVRRLRDRLATVDPTHNYIVTVRGHGLRLENPQLP